MKFWILAFLFLLFDIISKQIVLSTEILDVSRNTGIAFSLPVSNTIMIVATPILLTLFFYFAKKYFHPHWISDFVMALVFAGGTGNWIDRVFRGGVIDFIDLGFWPSFNLADSFLTISAFLLIFFYGKIVKDESRPS